MKDNELTGLYRKAVFAELSAYEGKLSSENGLDFSVKGQAESVFTDALPALVQKTILLCATENDNNTVELLNDALDMIISVSDTKLNKNVIDETYSLCKELELLAVGEARQSYDQLNSYYTTLLRQGTSNRGIIEKENRAIPSCNSNPTTPSNPQHDFKTAGQMLGRPAPPPTNKSSTSIIRKPIGLSKRTKTDTPIRTPMAANDQAGTTTTNTPANSTDENIDPRLKGIDPKLVETIQNEIIHRVDTVTWEQIAGLEHAKNTIKEIVIWPMLRPDIFTGLRGPPKGLLLFGPPGTGKTMIGKCIASQAKATFFSISASSLTSKWVGEGEKLVRALFACARVFQPSVIFIDEIDSLLTQRTDGEFEASRRIKTEFLVQFDGAATSSDDRILVIGATNRPQELDEAARRRLVKRLYIPLPDTSSRKSIIASLLSNQQHELVEDDFDKICKETDGYSGADMDNLCREAALGPIRSITNIMEISPDQVRAIGMIDFIKAMSQVRASVSSADLNLYLDWNQKFGSLSAI